MLNSEVLKSTPLPIVGLCLVERISLSVKLQVNNFFRNLFGVTLNVYTWVPNIAKLE